MSKVISVLSDYQEAADKRRSSFGTTDKYTTDLPSLDTYLGGGFGTQYGYEIITVFGETGVGKSLFALTMLGRQMTLGTKIGLMILEDDMADVYNRLRYIIGEQGLASIRQAGNVEVLPESMLEHQWQFADILDWLKDKHESRGISLFLIDHLQFIFDNVEVMDPRKEMADQRAFMRNLNFFCRKCKVTIILVSHTAKGEAEGMARVYGTTAITQVSTKVIGVKTVEKEHMAVTLYKSRFTRHNDEPHYLLRDGIKLLEEPVPFYPKEEPKRRGRK